MASGSDLGVVVVTGAAGALGRRVCTLAAADPAVTRVVAIDRRPVHAVPSSVDIVQADLGEADVKPLFEGAHVVVHLAQADRPEREGDSSASTWAGDAHLAHRVLDAASAAGVEHLVLLSSATAYGAWANNPLPLTEDAPLRPNPGVAIAAEKAEVERAAADWRDDHPGRRWRSSARRSPWLPRATGGWLGRWVGPPRSPWRPTTRRPSSSTSTTWRPPSTSPVGPVSTARATWPPTAGSTATPPARSPVVARGSGCPSGWPSGWPGGAGGWAWRRRRRCSCPTRCTPGWWPTTACGPTVGRPRAPTRKPSSPTTAPPPGRRSAPGAAKSSPWAPVGALLLVGVGVVSGVRRARRRA